MANMEDHLGNVYDSQVAMCKAYGVAPTLFRKRLTRGWTVKEALLGEREKIVYDENTVFGSIKEFKEHYGITDFAYTSLSKKYDSPKDIVNAFYNKKLVAPNGVGYSSYTKMCEDYGVSYNTFRTRLRNGHTLEEALTGVDWAGGVDDHNGVHHASVKAMCEAHGVLYASYAWRKKQGCTLEECLTKPSEIVDHLGNTYKSIRAMCREYNITPAMYYARKNKGYEIEDCLIS